MTGGHGKSIMRKKTKRKKNRLFVLSLSFLLAGGVCLQPFFIDVKGGEIAGTVGMLADTVTMWDIFNTVSAGAGVIVANDLLQSASQENLDDILGKPIGYINSQGLIEYNDGTSPPEWDWSGLEQALQNSGSARAKIIQGVFGQNGGTGQGGNDNDPWYRKFLNWAKAAVAQGKIYTSQVLGNVTPLSLDAISLMMGSYLGSFVEKAVPATTSNSIMAQLGSYTLYMNCPRKLYNTNTGSVVGDRNVIMWFPTAENTKIFTNINPSVEVRNCVVYIASKNTETLRYYYYQAQNGSDPNSTKQEFYVDIQPNNYKMLLNPSQGGSYAFKTNPPVQIYGNYVLSSDPVTTMNNWLNGTETIPTKKSPDVMTQYGPASGGSWVPTPYYDGEGNGEFQIIPQEVITEYTTYINTQSPTEEQAADAFEEAVNPYVQQEPLPSPLPTPAPEPVATPTTAPAYDPDAELGTPANPITVAEPNPVPGIGAGEGQLPGIAQVFPFCIPWDVKYILDMFTTDQDALAPHFEWNFESTIFGDLGTIVIDLSEFDSVAAFARKLEFMLFALALVIGTKSLIWS